LRNLGVLFFSVPPCLRGEKKCISLGYLEIIWPEGDVFNVAQASSPVYANSYAIRKALKKPEWLLKEIINDS